MFINKLREFMYGRYGTDQLNFALVILATLIIIINWFAGSRVLSLIYILILAYELYRIFSKNIYARRRENDIFLKFWNPVKKWFSTRRTRHKERKYYRYRTCPRCKATLRLPAKKGKHTAKCPRCNTEFEVRII